MPEQAQHANGCTVQVHGAAQAQTDAVLWCGMYCSCTAISLPQLEGLLHRKTARNTRRAHNVPLVVVLPLYRPTHGTMTTAAVPLLTYRGSSTAMTAYGVFGAVPHVLLAYCSCTARSTQTAHSNAVELVRPSSPAGDASLPGQHTTSPGHATSRFLSSTSDVLLKYCPFSAYLRIWNNHHCCPTSPGGGAPLPGQHTTSPGHTTSGFLICGLTASTAAKVVLQT